MTKIKEIVKTVAIHDGEIYIQTKYSGIGIRLIMMSNFDIYSWNGDPKQYISINKLIDWYEKEINYLEKYFPASKSTKILIKNLNTFKSIKNKFS